MVTIHAGNHNPLLIYPEVTNPPQSAPRLVRIWFVVVDLGQIMIARVDCHHKWGRLTGPNG